MNRFSYTLLLYLLAPFVWIYFVYRGVKDAEYRKNWSERLGYIASKIFEERSKNSHCLHIHCASVGESRAAFSLIISLIEKYPEAFILVTTITPTGRTEVIRLISDLEPKSKELKIDVCYLPIDWPGACRRFLDRITPSISILMETELWPNLIHQAKNRDIPVLLANARMSDASLQRYLKYPNLSHPMFASLTHIAAQFESDKNNFLSLGCDNKQISIVGSVKFDIHISDRLKQDQQELKNLWCANRPSWIAASIHPEEFELILDTHKRLLESIPNLLLIAVPRHSERFEELKNNCKKKNIRFVSRTENKPPTEDQSIVIVDTMGEMMLLFGAADIAFVGGSLMDRGGHNPIEPAACGLAVVMGFSVYNFSDVCRLMEKPEALTLVDNVQQLATTLERMLLDKDELSSKQKIAIKTIANNIGSVNKQISLIDKIVLLPKI